LRRRAEEEFEIICSWKCKNSLESLFEFFYLSIRQKATGVRVRDRL